MANRPRRQVYEREVYQHRGPPRPKHAEYTAYPYEEKHYKAYKNEPPRGREKIYNGDYHNADGHQESNLYEWGKWRTEINTNIIKDLMKSGKQNIAHERLVRTNEGYKHDRTNTKVHGDPRYVMSYSLSTNQVTELSPEEFLSYGIPRAKVNLNHRSNRKEKLENGYSGHHQERVDENVPNGHDYRVSKENTRPAKSANDIRYRERRRSPGNDYRQRMAHSPHKRSQYRNESPNHRYYDRGPHEREPAHYNGRQRSPQQKLYRRDSPERYRNYDSTQLSDDDDVNRQYDDRRHGDYEDMPLRRNSLVIDDANIFTPRTDYSQKQNHSNRDNGDDVDKSNNGKNNGEDIPESLQKVFATYKGDNKPVKVIPMPPPPPPPPPPLPPK